jgi:hypothetical protein
MRPRFPSGCPIRPCAVTVAATSGGSACRQRRGAPRVRPARALRGEGRSQAAPLRGRPKTSRRNRRAYTSGLAPINVHQPVRFCIVPAEPAPQSRPGHEVRPYIRTSPEFFADIADDRGSYRIQSAFIRVISGQISSSVSSAASCKIDPDLVAAPPRWVFRG